MATSPPVIEFGLSAKTFNVHSQQTHEFIHGVTELPIFKIMRASNSEVQASTLVKFIALGVAAKIIVVIKD